MEQTDITPKKDIGIDIVILWATFFNAFLAFINANVMQMSVAHVMMGEGVALLGCYYFIVKRYNISMKPWIFFIVFFAVSNLLFSIGNMGFNPKAFRDMLLIASFVMLGISYRGNPLSLLTKVTYIVIIFAFLEGFATQEIFMPLFNTAKYYLNTRGIGDEKEIMEMGGVFKNAIRYSGRFSLNLFNTHRLSSLFLEQTTLSNFAILLAIITSSLWASLTKHQKIIFPLAVFLILGFTDSRLALGLSGIIILMHFTHNFIPKKASLFYTPIILLLCAFIFYDKHIVQMSDTLGGRIGWTLHIISSMDLMGILGFGLADSPRTDDSGFGYILYNHSIWGLIAFWLYLGLALPQKTVASKKFSHGLVLFATLNLLVGPTFFSIKIAALTWFFVGYFIRQDSQSEYTLQDS